MSRNLFQFEKGVLNELEVSGQGLVINETVRMLGKVFFIIFPLFYSSVFFPVYMLALLVNENVSIACC